MTSTRRPAAGAPRHAWFPTVVCAAMAWPCAASAHTISQDSVPALERHAQEAESQVDNGPEPSPEGPPRRFYVGTNPLAPLMVIDHYLARMFFPFATGLEAGAVAVGGVHLSPNHALELRLSAGTAHKLGFSNLIQVEHGWRTFPLAGRARASGLYAGAHARWLRMHYRHPDERWHTIMILPVAGYVLTAGNVFVDLRLSQPLWAIGWSSRENTRPATGFILSPANAISPILPAFGVSVGWQFEPP